MAFVVVMVVVTAVCLLAAGTLWVLPLPWWAANKDAIQAFVLPFGAVGALVALAFAGWRSWAQFQQTQTDRRRHVTDSFKGAVELLGHEDRSVRLGAIYALERIARQNRDEHWPIMETLTAYVREWSERKWLEVAEIESAEIGRGEPLSALEPAPADIEAVFTVLGRRRLDHERSVRSAPRHLNLTRAYLVDADPDPSPRRDYEGAKLSRAKLSWSDLKEANLKETLLFGAKLKGAFLCGANLEGATLHEANLQGAYLDGVNARGCRFGKADLRGASLVGTELEGANLLAADLSTVIGLTQEQLNSAIGDTETKIPEGLTRPEHWSEVSASPDVLHRVPERRYV